MIAVKGEAGENVRIQIMGEAYPAAHDESDRDFLKASIVTNVTGFSASFDFLTRKSEIKYWIQQLQELANFKLKALTIKTIEENISIEFIVNEYGKICWDLDLRYPSGERNKLSVHFETGISEVEQFLNALKLLHFGAGR